MTKAAAKAGTKPRKAASGRSPGGNRRGRPTRARAAAIDEGIRAAALELFVDLGYEAASMDAVALKARVAKGTLYARYENKELLFRAIIEDELAQWSKWAGRQDHLLPGELAPRLRHHARVMLGAFRWPEYQRITRLVAAATPSLPAVARLWEEVGTRRYLRFLADDMAKAAGGADIDWEFYARVFVFTIAGWHRSEAADRDVGDDEIAAFADRVTDMIQAAIGGPAGPRR